MLAPATPLVVAQAAIQVVFRPPVASRALDLFALELSKALGELVLAHPERAGRLIAAVRRRGVRPVAVAGDSHSTLYIRRSTRNGRWLLPIHLFCTGASARGLANPGSRSGQGERVRAFAAALDGYVPLVLKFGQVDMEFVSVFKRLEANATVFDPAAFNAFCRETVARYAGFLDSAVPAKRRERTFVASIFPPALSDAAWAQGYVNAHIAELHGQADPHRLAAEVARLEVPSLAERTAMHARFNVRMRAAAAELGLSFLDDFTPLIGAGGTVDPACLGPSAGADHHLGFLATREKMVELLWAVTV